MFFYHCLKLIYKDRMLLDLSWFHNHLLVCLAVSWSLRLPVNSFSQKRLIRFLWFFCIMLEINNRQKLFGYIFSKRGQKWPIRGIYLIFWENLLFDISRNSREWRIKILFVFELKPHIWHNSCFSGYSPKYSCIIWLHDYISSKSQVIKLIFKM